MSTVARHVAAIPVRLASESWSKIVDLVAPAGPAHEELNRAMGIAASLITSEAMKESPVVVTGTGPRVRVYCVYGEDAIEGSRINEATLAQPPTQSTEWQVSLPCLRDDLPWVQAALKKLSSRITARDVSEGISTESNLTAPEKVATINREAFLRP